MPKTSRAEGYAAVSAFTVLANVPFLGKYFHIDETYYLAPVAQILKDPFHPLSFTFNWIGRGRPYWELSAHSILLSYPLALASWLARGSLLGIRLLCLPVDVVSACALYWLAARFLKRPLWPVLLILAGPAWFIGMPLLMAEKWVVCVLLLSLVALLRGLDGDPVSYWLSAGLISFAVNLKYTAAFVLFPAVALQWPRKVPRERLLAYLSVCVALPLIDAIWLEPWRLPDTAPYAAGSDHSGPGRVQHFRALLAFPAALGFLFAALPFVRSSASPRRRIWTVVAALAAAVIVFAPFLDGSIRPIAPFDRLLGVFFSFATLAVLAKLLEPASRRLPGARLWLPWAFAGFAMCEANYLVSARAALLFLPAMVLACAERLEAERDRRFLNLLYGSCFAATLAVSLLLARVDADFAGAEASVARAVMSRNAGMKRKVWFAGHWGFQRAMEDAGAADLDADLGGWRAVKPGDLVVIPANNAVQFLPPDQLRYEVSQQSLEEPIPLRLIDVVGGHQAGFYASPYGFLPYAFGSGPLDVITFVHVL